MNGDISLLFPDHFPKYDCNLLDTQKYALMTESMYFVSTWEIISINDTTNCTLTRAEKEKKMNYIHFENSVIVSYDGSCPFKERNSSYGHQSKWLWKVLQFCKINTHKNRLYLSQSSGTNTYGAAEMHQWFGANHFGIRWSLIRFNNSVNNQIDKHCLISRSKYSVYFVH